MLFDVPTSALDAESEAAIDERAAPAPLGGKLDWRAGIKSNGVALGLALQPVAQVTGRDCRRLRDRWHTFIPHRTTMAKAMISGSENR
mgnify:CR=1 FL=1